MSVIRRIPMKQILKQKRSVIVAECLRAFDAGATFEFGVDRTELGFRLTVNGQIIGIYLYPDSDEFRRRIAVSYAAVITPSQVCPGSIEQTNKNGIVIYVLPEEYEQFCRDAETVHTLYCFGDLCFRGIPDIWFDDLALVRFIRDHLRLHPNMSLWFGPGLHGTSRLWLSPELESFP
ncbi:MAG: hypothetical protein SXV54_12165 [Chloroflexota bacterium]|nr:hypothetical protein [Chloroflexota bacterium]